MSILVSTLMLGNIRDIRVSLYRGIASDFLDRKLHVRRKIDLRALLGSCERVI